MTPYLDIPISEPSQVGEARRAAARLTRDLGFDDVASGRVALIVTELGNNLALHAQRGRLLLGSRAADATPAFEVLSLDHGPGMVDLDRCLRDGYSTGGTLGTGLGAVQRLAGEFSAFSAPASGTVIAARVFAAAVANAPASAARFVVSGICLAAPGETVSGDAWDVRMNGDKAALIVADGLGHGPLAAAASTAAVDEFRSAAGAPGAVLARAHQSLHGTRGAAVAMTELDADAATVTFAGAGNIAGRIISGVGDRSLLSQHGTVGLQVRRISELLYPWPEHALLVLHSDGITSRWSLAAHIGLLRCDPAVIAGWLIRDHCRGRDDVTVVVVRRA